MCIWFYLTLLLLEVYPREIQNHVKTPILEAAYLICEWLVFLKFVMNNKK